MRPRTDQGRLMDVDKRYDLLMEELSGLQGLVGRIVEEYDSQGHLGPYHIMALQRKLLDIQRLSEAKEGDLDRR